MLASILGSYLMGPGYHDRLVTDLLTPDCHMDPDWKDREQPRVMLHALLFRWVEHAYHLRLNALN